MLVVTANWGIGDGSLRAAPGPSAVARFVADVHRAAVQAGWREDGRYAPIDDVDVVLAGDTFDTILSREWLGRARPWQRGAGARATHERVVTASRSAFRTVLAPLVETLARGIEVPRASARARPAAGLPLLLPLRVTILGGNLDPDVSEVLAGVSDGIPGLHVGSVWEDGRTGVEHGHEGDWFWHASPRAPTLGASLRIDLLGRFLLSPSVAGLGTAARRRLAARLSSTDDWSRWDTSFGGHEPGERESLAHDWGESVVAWRKAARAAGIEGDVSCDVVDAIAASLRGDLGPTGATLECERGDRRAAIVARGGHRLAGTHAPATVVLGHPRGRASRLSSAKRVVRLGEDVAAAEAPIGGVREIVLPQPESLDFLVVPSSSSGFPVPETTILPEWGGRRGGTTSPASEGGRFRIVEAA